MLDGWHEFYTLLGTSAAGLLALLFVAASIGAGYLSAERNSPTRTFTSPVVFHYAYILFASLVALMPVVNDLALGAIIGVSAAGGLAYAGYILIRVMRSTTTDIDDHLGYGATPPIGYALTLAAALFIAEGTRIGPPLLAAALMLLLLVNVRNAWDLTVYFAQRRSNGPPP